MAGSKAHFSVDSPESPGSDDVELAFEGITMLLNNKWKDAEELFVRYKDFSPLMHAGSSLVIFLQALMTFEDEKLANALQMLQETEKKCENKDGFMKNLKRKFGKKGSENSSKSEDRLQRQIIIADSLMYQAVLTFINQDIASYVKGGWILRKAWKIYEKVHKEIVQLQNKSNHRLQNSMSNQSLPRVNSLPTTPTSSDEGEGQLSDDTLARLLGAVSFGYGTFQLCISMMPPKILKLIEFLGFEGDRDVGLGALDVASHSKDMKAPMATLALLWYHTVIRPFFALDGAKVEAGVDEAQVIIERCEREYPTSALFLFFKGRAQRLQSQLDESLATYRAALEACEEQREVQLICLYEIGWCNMMKLNWQEGLECFVRLKEDSRWSKSYYSYLTAVCQGSLGLLQECQVTFQQVPILVKRKNNQIEAFVSRRAEKFRKNMPTQQHVNLLAMEVLFLWNALPTCNMEDIKTMQQQCSAVTERHLLHISCLIEGALYRELGQEDMAIQCFKESIARHQGMKDDHHIPAFASYEIGTILVQRPESFTEGKQYLNTAKDNFKDYDFENRLNVRIHAALKRLKSQGTPV